VASPGVNDDGSLRLRAQLVIPANEIDVRVTTSGGPGGQHANRSLTKVVVSLRVEESETLSESEKRRLVEHFGPVVRSSASRFRSQGQNREAAFNQLASKLSDALAPRAPRRETKPSARSKERRVDEKKARGRLKEMRRARNDD
jgi:ribosome-associated protein